MHFKLELEKILNTCKQGFVCPVPSSLLIKLLYSARNEKGKPLVDFLYEFIELGFNPFEHNNDFLLRVCIKNIVAVCDKELSIIKTHPNPYEPKKENK